jgi:hypothetical protein
MARRKGVLFPFHLTLYSHREAWEIKPDFQRTGRRGKGAASHSVLSHSFCPSRSVKKTTDSQRTGRSGQAAVIIVLICPFLFVQ